MQGTMQSIPPGKNDRIVRVSFILNLGMVDAMHARRH